MFNAQGERQELERTWEDQLEQWRAKQPDGTKEAPFRGASNIKFPLAQQHVDPVLSDLVQTLHGSQNFWNTRARRGQNTPDQAQAVNEGLRVLDEDFLKMRDVNKRGLLTACIHGTAIYKSHWLHQRKTVKDYDESGEITDKVKVRSQPAIDHIPLQRFFFPPEAWSLNAEDQGGAQWVAERLELKENELRARAQSEGAFRPPYDPEATEFVLQQARDQIEDEEVSQKIREQAEYEPFREQSIRIWEVWARFDVDGDGIDEDIFVIWHQETATVLRALHNPFLHGKRPYEAINYLPTQGIYGVGIIEKDEWAQQALTKLINAQVDNALIANTRMFSAPEGGSVQPGEPIYPGKIWLHERGEQIDAMQAGEIYPSLPQTISQFMQISENVTGVSEVRQGNVSELPSRTPASTTLQLLQEGSKRFDFILSNMREPFGRLGMKVLQNLAQYHRDNPVKWRQYFRNTLGPQDADQFIDVLEKPIHNIEQGFDISLQATSSQANREAEKQNFLSMIQLVGQVGSQLIQLAQLAEGSPQGSATQQTAARLFRGGTELLEELLERFDFQDADDIAPVQVAQQMQNLTQDQQAGGGQQAPAPQPGQTLGGLQGAPQPPSQAVRQALGLDGGGQ